MSEIEKSYAPWTEDQVESLNAFQNCGYWHEFTGEHGVLTATKNGWVDGVGSEGKNWEDGLIVQTWAHIFMTNWGWKRGELEPVSPARELSVTDEDEEDETADSDNRRLVQFLTNNDVKIVMDEARKLGHDPYMFVVSRALEKSVADVTKQERDKVKLLCFTFIYGSASGSGARGR